MQPLSWLMTDILDRSESVDKKKVKGNYLTKKESVCFMVSNGVSNISAGSLRHFLLELVHQKVPAHSPDCLLMKRCYIMRRVRFGKQQLPLFTRTLNEGDKPCM